MNETEFSVENPQNASEERLDLPGLETELSTFVDRKKWWPVIVSLSLSPIFGTWAWVGISKNRLPDAIFVGIGVVSVCICITLITHLKQSKDLLILDSPTVTVLGGVLGVIGLGGAVAFGYAHQTAPAMLALVPYLVGLGLVICPADSFSDRLALAPSIGIGVSLATFTIIGTFSRISKPWSISALLILVVAFYIRRAVERRSATLLRPSHIDLGLATIIFAISVVLAIGLWVIALPYIVFHPAVPLGIDVHHRWIVRVIAHSGTTPVEPQPAYYPYTFEYWAAGVALLTQSPVITMFRSLPSVLWFLGACQLILIGNSVFGRRAALFAGAAYCLWSFQPRQTVFDSTDMGVLAEYLLLPAALFAALKFFQTPSRRTALIFGSLVAITIQTHFIATSRLLGVLFVFSVIATLASPDRRELLKQVSLAVLCGTILGLPFSIKYLNIYAAMVLDKLSGHVNSTYSASFPKIVFPGDYLGIMGKGFIFIACGAVIAFILERRQVEENRQLSWYWLVSWIGFTEFAVATSILLTPERDLRSLAIPLALTIGWAIDAAVSSVPSWSAPVLATSLFGIASASGIPSVAMQSLNVGQTESFATVSQMTFLKSLHLGQLRGTVATDESGVWAQYFAASPAIIVEGGPAGWRWYGQAQRHEFKIVYDALHNPCTADTATRLHSLGVSYVYLGAPPLHWVLPGYTYASGSRLLGCQAFKLLRRDPNSGGWLFAVR